MADRALMVPFLLVKAALVYTRKVPGYRASPISHEGFFDVRLG